MQLSSFSYLSVFLDAAAPEAAQSFMSILPIPLMLLVVYFLIMRPQQKAQKAHKAFISSLKKGDEVVTQGGMVGRIEAVEDGFVRLEVARDVKIKVLKTSVAAPTAASTGSGETVKASLEAKKE